MIGPLAQLFTGAFTRYGLTLQVRRSPDPYRTEDCFTLPHFLQGAPLAEALRRYALTYPDAPPKALASLWSKLYFNALLVPVLAAAAITNWIFPTKIDEMTVQIALDGTPLALGLPHEGGRCQHSASLSPEQESSLFTLVREHLHRFITDYARHTGLAPRLLWNSAAVIVEDTLEQCAQLAPGHAGVAAYHALLITSTQWPDGADNPLSGPTRLHVGKEKTIRLRRLCCLRYAIASLDYCVDCPLSCRKRV